MFQTTLSEQFPLLSRCIAHVRSGLRLRQIIMLMAALAFVLSKSYDGLHALFVSIPT